MEEGNSSGVDFSVSSLRVRVWREKFISEIDRGKQVFIKADEDGQIWSAYFDPTNGIHLHNAESGKDLLVASAGRASLSGLAFDAVKGHFFAAWRQKAGGKKLFFRASHDNGKTLSEPVLLDDGKTAPLPKDRDGSKHKGRCRGRVARRN